MTTINEKQTQHYEIENTSSKIDEVHEVVRVRYGDDYDYDTNI